MTEKYMKEDIAKKMGRPKMTWTEMQKKKAQDCVV